MSRTYEPGANINRRRSRRLGQRPETLSLFDVSTTQAKENLYPTSRPNLAIEKHKGSFQSANGSPDDGQDMKSGSAADFAYQSTQDSQVYNDHEHDEDHPLDTDTYEKPVTSVTKSREVRSPFTPVQNLVLSMKHRLEQQLAGSFAQASGVESFNGSTTEVVAAEKSYTSPGLSRLRNTPVAGNNITYCHTGMI